VPRAGYGILFSLPRHTRAARPIGETLEQPCYRTFPFASALPGGFFFALAAGIAGAFCTPAYAQLRIATWNISNYGGGRDADIKIVVYGQFQGRSFAPDAICAQEFLSSAALTNFVNDLNTAAAAPAIGPRPPTLTARTPTACSSTAPAR